MITFFGLIHKFGWLLALLENSQVQLRGAGLMGCTRDFEVVCLPDVSEVLTRFPEQEKLQLETKIILEQKYKKRSLIS